MITGIAIENFKGIRERVEIELRPITLLFGANSAGKSTILHALHYAREVFERHRLNADSTTAGGNAIDLGGFRNFVHGQNTDLPIRLTFRIDAKNWDTEETEELELVNEFLGTNGMTGFAVSVEKVEITLEIRWSGGNEKPYVACFVYKLDGTEFLNITSDPDGKRVELRINSDHPRLERMDKWRSIDHVNMADMLGSADQGDVADMLAMIPPRDDESETCLAICLESLRETCVTTSDGAFYLQHTNDALLDVGKYEAIPFVPDMDAFMSQLKEQSSQIRPVHGINEGIGRILWPALQDILDFLSTIRHLGPLREVPPRNYAPSSMTNDDSRWASGLGAWDRLSSADDKLVENVSDWLGDEDRLNSGHRLRMKRFKELDMGELMMIHLIRGRAFDDAEPEVLNKFRNLPTKSRLLIVSKDDSIELQPNDVGIGLSQLIPVIVTALDGHDRVLSIEQPELHLHPKLQAEVADLFIHGAATNKHHFILETHSEHLILRLLRRIRETSDGELPSNKLPLTPDEIAVYYIDGSPNGVTATHLRVDETGEFIDRWPKGFFDERAKELF